MNKEEVDKFCKEYYGFTLEDADGSIGYWMGKYQELEQENKELKEDLKFVLEQVLGAFVQNWCIDWNFNDIRKKYNISDKYDWNSDVDE